jgi:hypothetical protein
MDLLVLDYIALRGKIPKFVSEVNVVAGRRKPSQDRMRQE